MPPTIAELLISSGLESAQKAPDISGAITQGAELALNIEKMRQSKLDLAQKKAENNLAKYSKSLELLKIAHESKDPAIADSIFKHALPNQVRALGTSDVFTEEFLQTAAKSPETREKALGYALEIERRISEGEKAADVVGEIAATIPDPAVRAVLDTDRIIKAQATKASEDQLNKRAKMAADAQMGRQKDAQESAGEVEVSKKVGDKFATWTAGGGEAANVSYEDILRRSKGKLLNRDVVLGSWDKKLPWGGDEDVLARTDEKTKALIDDIRGGISIKEKTGDPNPTEKQITRILTQIIDPRLSNEANIKKIDDAIKKSEMDRKTKMDEFRRYGYVKDSAKTKKTMTPEQKKRYDSLPPAEQAKVRKALGLE